NASGVTSRPVTPVPPVEITTSISGSAIQALSWATIAAWSSRTIFLAATLWPSRTIMSARLRPDLSSASVRVSETVRTAMFTGRNGRDSSIFGMADTGLRAVIESGIDRPLARGKRIEVRRRLAQAQPVDPIIRHDLVDEQPRFPVGNAFDEQQRVAVLAGRRFHAGQNVRSAVIGDREIEQVAVHPIVAEQLDDVLLRQRQVDGGIRNRAMNAGMRRHGARGARHELHQARRAR